MRALVLFLLLVPALLPAGASAQARLNKCIDAHGKVTYSNLPCRNAREVRAVEIDPAPQPDPVRVQPAKAPAVPPAKPAAPAAAAIEPAPIQGVSKRVAPASTPPRQCDLLTEQLGRVFDKMDQARRKGSTPEEMEAWNKEASALERQKQQAGCF